MISPLVDGLSRHKLVALLLAAVLVGGLYIGGNWWNNRDQARAGTTDYVTFTVQRGDITTMVTGSAPVTPLERYEVTSGVTGTVRRLHVQEGHFVEAGELLLELDNGELELAAQKADLSYQLAQINLDQLINPADPTDLDVKAARLKIEQAELALAEKRSLADKLEVKNPFRGEVDFAVKVGDSVTAGDLLATVYTTKELQLEVQVRESQLAEVQVGQEIQVHFPALSQSYTGVVAKVGREGTPQSGTGSYANSYFPIWIDINDARGVRPGMSASTHIFYRGENQYGEEERVYTSLGNGVAVYKDQQEIRAETAGKVAELLVVDSSTTIGAGFPLLRLENEDILNQVKQAELNLAQAENELERLLNPEYTAEELARQEINLEQARLELENRINSLNDLKITAPISGRVIDVAVAAGDTVSSQELLLTIANYDSMQMVMAVDELDIAEIQEGQKAVITVDALPGRQYQGKVIAIAPEGTVQGEITTYDVTIQVLEPGELRSGMRATATIITAQRQDVLQVPAEAVTFSPGTSRGMVEVLVEGKVERRPVEIGLAGTQFVEITGGLTEGEEVIITGGTSAIQNRLSGMMPGMMPGTSAAPRTPGAEGRPGGSGRTGN